jgi:hypothetical protein
LYWHDGGFLLPHASGVVWERSDFSNRYNESHRRSVYLQSAYRRANWGLVLRLETLGLLFQKYQAFFNCNLLSGSDCPYFICDLGSVDSFGSDSLFASLIATNPFVWISSSDVGDALHLDQRAATSTEI